jgi:thymidine kinase
MFECHIYLGPMFSGKSSELIRQFTMYSAIGKHVLMVNHIIDTRTEDFIETHDQNRERAVKTSRLCKLIEDETVNKYDVICVDEGQFFDDLRDFILKLENTDKIMYIAGLDGDSERNPFGQMLDCIPLCDTVVKLRALDMIDCDGNTKAPFTKRYKKQ